MNPTVQGMALAAAAGFVFAALNANLRGLASELPPFQVQFLRYAAGLVVMLPLIWRTGLAAYRPKAPGGQVLRGAVHTIALFFWFAALPHIAFADMTAIGFTGPIFIMLGAALFLKEPMFWQRWAAALLGFAGVLVVVGPKLSGAGGQHLLVMLASAPLFAASFLMAKALTRHDRPEVIVAWQALTVALFTLPVALWLWQAPGAGQWAVVLLCGALGSLGHWLLTTAYRLADISSAQPVKFLDLIWAALLGHLLFHEVPSPSTLAGAAVIFLATSWIARVESRRGRSTRP
ncbi:MAG: DMT family transporter [Roseococcus sp.]|nr:DMT family transporter [Roseococcus sp.]